MRRPLNLSFLPYPKWKQPHNTKKPSNQNYPMKILFFTPFDMLHNLDEAFPPGSTPTDEEIEEIIYGSDVIETNLEDVDEYTIRMDVIHLLNQAQNYDNYAILDGSEPYYKYFTGETK